MAAAYEFLDLEFDSAACQLRRGRDAISLQPRLVDLLRYLIENRDRVVTRSELLEHVWAGASVSNSAVTQAVKELRRSIEVSVESRGAIRTVRSRGYQFAAPVEIRADDSSQMRARDPFVGRRRIVGDLEQALNGLERGFGGLILLSGEPGIGKSRTAEEISRRARRKDIRVILGRCPELHGAPVYWPWTQVLRGLLEMDACGSIGADRASVIADFLPELLPFVIGRQEMQFAPRLDSEAAQFRFRNYIATTLIEMSEDQPILITLDDIHRADLPSLQLLEYLAAELSNTRVCVIATCRDVVIEKDAARRAVIGRLLRAGSRNIHLEPLSREESAELVSLYDVAKRAPDAPGRVASGSFDEFVDAESELDAIHSRSGGNPFFIKELVRFGSPPCSMRADSTAASRSISPQAGLLDSIQQHLTILDKETRDLLNIAAACGRESEPRILALAAGLDVETVLSQIDDAVAARVLEFRGSGSGDERTQFVHTLISETLYAALPAERRLQLHAQIADALVELYPVSPDRLSAIAYHEYRAAPLGRKLRAAIACEEAAREACRCLAHDDEARLYAEAGELMRGYAGEEERLARVLACLGEARFRLGDHSGSIVHFLEAMGLADSIGHRVLYGRATLGFAGHEEPDIADFERIATLEYAISKLGDPDRLNVILRARLALAKYFVEPHERAVELAWEAVELGRAFEEPDTLAYALSCAHRVIRRNVGQLHKQVRIARELRSAGERSRAPVFKISALSAGLGDSLQLGDGREFQHDLQRLEGESVKFKQPYGHWMAGIFRVVDRHLAGHFDEAEAEAKRALEIGRGCVGDVADLNYMVQLLALRRDQGLTGELEESIRYYARGRNMLSWRLITCEIEVCSGETEDAYRTLEELTDADLAQVPRSVDWLQNLVLLCSLWESHSDPVIAASLYRNLRPFSGFHAVSYSGWMHRGSVDMWLGVLAARMRRYEDSEKHFGDAMRMDVRLGSRPFLAYDRLHCGEMMLRRGTEGDLERGASLLRDACSDAVEMNMPALLDRAEGSLDRA
jgi:DNA-binding winged helix-turn-helix (wHTH) protein/tetratricopeptide (TPR) repeat protein